MQTLLLKSPIGFKRSYSTSHTHLECNLKIPPTQSHLSSVVRGWDLLLLGRVCVWGGGGGGGTKGFNRSSCDVMEWVQELVHCEGGLDRVEFG